MKEDNRIMLLSGLVDEDDAESIRNEAIEIYEDQLLEDCRLAPAGIEDDVDRRERIAGIEENYDFEPEEVQNESELQDYSELLDRLSSNVGTSNFVPAHLSEKEDQLSDLLNNGKFAVQGGIGPGFQAYDGERTIKNPFENIQIIERWYLSEEVGINPNDPMSVSMNEDGTKMHGLPKKVGPFEYIASNGDYDVYQGPDYRIGITKDEWGLYAYVPGPLGGIEETGDDLFDLLKKAHEAAEIEIDDPHPILRSRLREELEEVKEQPDLPGELNDDFFDMKNDDAEDAQREEMNIEFPQDLALELMNWHGGQGSALYSLASSTLAGHPVSLSMMDNALSDLEHLERKEDWRRSEEDQNSLDELIFQLQELINQHENPTNEPLIYETVEGTDGNLWDYRRTGTSDGVNLRFRENPYDDEDDDPEMHIEGPEQPSTGWPTGYTFYEPDHTYQKIMKKKADPLDMGEEDAELDQFLKFFKKNRK